MFSTENLYKMFKPDSNPTLITNYDIYIGGTTLPIDYSKGAIMIYNLNAIDVTSQFKDMLKPTDSKEKGRSIVQISYQVDIYKKNAKNLKYIEVEREAIKIKEWLKSFEIQEYLETLESEILPCYSQIRFMLNEEINKDFINRASFDFSILTINEIREQVTIIENIVFDKTIILQGDKTYE